MKRKLKILGFSNKGYSGQVFTVETDIRNGFPGFDIVGLADNAIKESRERVKTALRNCGFQFPQQRVLVSLAPADTPKSGSLIDLAIALSILFANSQTKEGETLKVMVAGELSLNGEVLPDNAAIGAVQAGRKNKCQLCIVPKIDIVEEKGICTVQNLTEAFVKCGEYLNSNEELVSLEQSKPQNNEIFTDVIGMEREKDILCLAACGFHSILLFGPPGVGKTMLSNKLNMLMPSLSLKDKLEIAHINGCSDSDYEEEEISPRPKKTFVPHDCSLSQFIGGTGAKTPGLGAVSHLGTLVLDELNKYTPTLLEAVKDTYDQGCTISSKSGETVSYPAKYLMIANMNPCSCGGLGSTQSPCSCTSQKLSSHWNRIGKALLERFDIRLPIEEYNILNMAEQTAKSDTYYTDRINLASERQQFRFKDTNITFNGQAHYAISPFRLFREETTLLASLEIKRNNFPNTRNQLSLITLARTIADYDDRDKVTEEDFKKAMELRKYCTNGDYYWRTIN